MRARGRASPLHLTHADEVELGEALLARELSLLAASWIVVELGGTAARAQLAGPGK